MRTAIFLGLIYVGNSIGKTAYGSASDGVYALLASAFVVFVFMDVVDFLRNRKTG
jgi:hypothetical protein